MSDRVGRGSVIAFLGLFAILFAAAAALRGAWLTADPPTQMSVGVVWHDEGAWVHNARNRVLWGTWRTDDWNPMFVAPVFTALEYVAFRALGVGTWQARTVPVASGLLAVAALCGGLAALAGRRAALIGGCLLATNYVFVMWNRAALMESTMTAFIASSWAAYAVAERRPMAGGLLAGTAVVLAWFTKAAAAFFVAALVLDATATLVLSRWERSRGILGVTAPSPEAVRAAGWTLSGMAVAAALVLLAFVLPYWSEYQFYNWQMSVTRKPSYTVRDFLDRASWLPIVQSFFSRMWLVTVIAALSLITIALRWRTARPAERLLVLWVLLGLAELVVHDAGNERRYVMFIPALAALAALLLGRRGFVAPPPGELDRHARWLALPLVLLAAYLVFGGMARLAWLGEIGPAVHLSAALAVVAGALIVWRWQSVWGWLARQRITAGAAAGLTGLAIAGDLTQYWQWARQRTSFNHEASVALRGLLPDGTLVHGKLANGLSLENRIQPIFVGTGFGNYADRKQRDDVRYILTIVHPRIGYEGRVILDVLEAYPQHRILTTFPVAETTFGRDRAALIDKFGNEPQAARAGRAQD